MLPFTADLGDHADVVVCLVAVLGYQSVIEAHSVTKAIEIGQGPFIQPSPR